MKHEWIVTRCKLTHFGIKPPDAQPSSLPVICLFLLKCVVSFERVASLATLSCFITAYLFSKFQHLCFVSDIADAASDMQDLLVPDTGAQYDRLIEINLDEVCPLSNFRKRSK